MIFKIIYYKKKPIIKIMFVYLNLKKKIRNLKNILYILLY